MVPYLLFSHLLLIPLFSSPSQAVGESTYLYTYCSSAFNYTSNGEFQRNLVRLLTRRLYIEGGIAGFNNTTEGEKEDEVYGLFLCRGDVSPTICQGCIDGATFRIQQDCPVQKEAIIWYDQCLVRYSSRNFFSILETDPVILLKNTQNVGDPNKLNKSLALLFKNITVAVSDPLQHMYATQEANFSKFGRLYGLVQCTRDLSAANCELCLNSAVAILMSRILPSSGGRTLGSSCNIRYELYPFHGDPRVEAQPATQSSIWNGSKNDSDNKPTPETPISVNKNSTGIPGRQGNRSTTWIALAPTILGIALICFCIFIVWRRKKLRQDDDIQELQLLDLEGERFGDEISNGTSHGTSAAKSKELPLIQLDIVSEATKHFAKENKLGEGGFGPVYKGVLVDGKEIAVKRLSRNSSQGLAEFKNEVILICRLQHKNLVRLLGCCLEREEKLLIYEFMPNKSLDFFLFDSSMGLRLNWQRRFSIINGISRGLLYLHEDSRLRVIHRDLKASNILLDEDMNPKISDFGMARIFGGNQSEANTNRIVGTYGYMAPEYAMEGLFSVKSDVFSFGVLLLEIISGRKNTRFHLSEHGESLLTFAWKLWSKGQCLEMMDPSIAESHSPLEVLKCICIGLLCVQEDPADRPTMASVVVMLASESATIPKPTRPAFSVGRFDSAMFQPSSTSNPCTVDELDLSNLSPR